MFVLEEIYKSKKVENSEQFNLRIQRGLSWFKKAVQLDDDLDLKFISLWIGFNAVYAQELMNPSDPQGFEQFLGKVCQFDQQQKIYHLIWDKLNQSVRVLLVNPYVFQSFWDFQNKKISQTDWKGCFDLEKIRVDQLIQSKDTVDLLFTIFSRLRTLRNQIMHGGSTYKSAINRQQLKDACHILATLLSTFLYILLDHPKELDVEQSFYPVVNVC
ncbi:HEPN domain-containing protein [Acinetobacter wuhouensis]|uniref:Uncharacterized protein n=1 Tax=Acinetobacter wuhouensis TaxID=1879050 RepID=A0A4Q7AQ35_9GAMM|nr:HEPN domain-containing protein [Acinetobacter wuhouensis]RZG47485.1 hypothetical protein EXU28_06035 [Acinetobacter wuhouensis]